MHLLSAHGIPTAAAAAAGLQHEADLDRELSALTTALLSGGGGGGGGGKAEEEKEAAVMLVANGIFTKEGEVPKTEYVERMTALFKVGEITMGGELIRLPAARSPCPPPESTSLSTLLPSIHTSTLPPGFRPIRAQRGHYQRVGQERHPRGDPLADPPRNPV